MNQPPQQNQIHGEAEHANPDLDRILAELAGFTGSNDISTQPTVTTPVQLFPNQHVPVREHIPTQDSLPAAPTIAERPRDPRLADREPPTRIATPPTHPSTPLIDPSTIFEWPTALRCVNKLSASNPHFGPKIKEMMADQDRNVKQWWNDRNSLINTQKTKNEGRRSLNEVLKGIGGKIEAESTPEEDAAELARFDKKVYGASQQMSKYHGIELKRLGVPFFGVDSKHIVANELQQTTAARNALSQAMMTEAELSELQRKMVQYLEDMFKG